MDTESLSNMGQRCRGDEEQKVELGLDMGIPKPVDLIKQGNQGGCHACSSVCWANRATSLQRNLVVHLP